MRKIVASGGKRGASSASRTGVRKCSPPATSAIRLAGGHRVVCRELARCAQFREEAPEVDQIGDSISPRVRNALQFDLLRGGRCGGWPWVLSTNLAGVPSLGRPLQKCPSGGSRGRGILEGDVAPDLLGTKGGNATHVIARRCSGRRRAGDP